MNDSLAYFILNLIQGIGPVTVQKLISALGSPAEILNARLKDLTSIDGIGIKTAELITTRKSYVDWEIELENCKKNNVHIITPADKEYPDALRTIYDPPLCLYVKGNLEVLQNYKKIAFVGTRNTSYYGVQIAETFAKTAVTCGWTVVSGLARGIDTVAHKAVVEANGATIAVIGSGLGKLYPTENIELARDICEKGAIISEFPLSFPPERRSFPMRNRIISGLSLGTLVVEGSVQSGSMITAMQAIEQGRTVFAVPGLITNPQATGCHKLIKDGAILVENFFDVSKELVDDEFVLKFQENSDSDFDAEEESLPLSELEKKIVLVLKKSGIPIGADEISELSEIKISELLSSLMVLEIKKIIRQLPGMLYTLK